MPKITILPDAVSGEIKTGTNLLKSAEMLGVELLHSCGGMAACTTCRIVVKQGNENLSRIKLAEEEVLAEAGILHSHRLACQARVFGDVIFERPVWTLGRDSSLTGD
ncbi:MAG: 2Fe-2S ferredoxin [Acidobacteria bacterium]|nr:MAG: 2Fe-2S ferredoxin [Acidobacteriota bacterium]